MQPAPITQEDDMIRATATVPGGDALRIVQFGLPYSPNLGDGVISECIRFGIGRLLPDAQMTAIDLSARRAFGEQIVRNRQLALKLLSHLPAPLRRALVSRKLGRVLDRVTPEWQAAVDEADLVLIGGGQLFSDADLNFPLKVSRAADLCTRSAVPVSVYAVGVAQNWSPTGAALFARLTDTNLRCIGLRDAPSRQAWLAQMSGDGPQPVLLRDPGLLARPCYGPVEADARVGVCVSDPDILKYHADGAPTSIAFEPLIRTLLERGYSLRLFCNGATEDAAALRKTASAFGPEIANGSVEVARVPERPHHLARLVAECQAVVAHRLHACIVAYSYRRPVVGLGWDRKVESFFASVQQHAAFAPAGASAPDIAERLARAIDTGISEADAAAVEDEALDGLRLALAPLERDLRLTAR